MGKLALLGGPKAVTLDKRRFAVPPVSEEAIAAVVELMRKARPLFHHQSPSSSASSPNTSAVNTGWRLPVVRQGFKRLYSRWGLDLAMRLLCLLSHFLLQRRLCLLWGESLFLPMLIAIR